MKRQAEMQKTNTKKKTGTGGLSKLVRYLGQYKGRLIAVAVLALFATVFSVFGPKVLALATDELTGGVMSGSGVNFGYIGTVLLLALGIYLISAAFSTLMGKLMADVSSDVSYSLRRDISSKTNRVPLSCFDKTSRGDILSVMTNDVDTVSQALNQSVTQLITAVLTIIGVFIMMMTISPLLALVSLIIVPVSLLVVALIVKKSQQHFKNQQTCLGAVNGHVEEMYSGHLVNQAYNGQEKALQTFDSHNGKLETAARKSDFLSGILQPLTGFIGNLGYVAVCIIGAAMAAAGSMTIGGIQAFVQYIRSFSQPISQAANISGQIQQLSAASDRIFAFLEEEEEQEENTNVAIATQNVQGDVLFDHVSFAYNNGDRNLIEDFSADIHAGQKVAIVGPTGAGKSTIVKLLMRFYDLSGGSVFLDGYDITGFDRKDLRSAFGMVLQDTWLFSGSVMDNIRYGRLDATDEEVVEAAKAAQADSFIRMLPDGYQTEINEAVSNLSQGQKQLLTIARVILSQSRVLILDEATSSVDTATEVQLQTAMDNMTRGRTSFIIAHRLSTIQNADLILYLQDGNILEQGTHDELMELGGAYADLHNSQYLVSAGSDAKKSA